MDDKFLAQLLSEMCNDFGEALSLVTGALARQIDATAMADHLRAQIKAAGATRRVSSKAIEIATHALAAVEAESAFQQKLRH